MVSFISPTAPTSSAILLRTPVFLRVIILLKAIKLTQFAPKAIRMAEAKDRKPQQTIMTNAHTSPTAQTTCEYQKIYSYRCGHLKLASYTHTSSSPSQSMYHEACKYNLPIFFVIQNSNPAPRAMKTVAQFWGRNSPRTKMRTKRRTLAKMIWKMGEALGLKKVLVPFMAWDWAGRQITDAIIVLNYNQNVSLNYTNNIPTTRT